MPKLRAAKIKGSTVLCSRLIFCYTYWHWCVVCLAIYLRGWAWSEWITYVLC